MSVAIPQDEQRRSTIITQQQGWCEWLMANQLLILIIIVIIAIGIWYWWSNRDTTTEVGLSETYPRGNITVTRSKGGFY